MFGRKKDPAPTASSSDSTVKRTGSKWLYPMTALLLFLLFVSFVLQLAATAALQQNCGASGANRLWGGVGFFGNTSCDKMYRFLWFITFLTLFVLLLVLASMAARFIHKMRSGLVGLLAVLTVLLMERTDTMLYAAEIASGVDGTLAARARTYVAGGIIGAFAAGLLMLFVGIHDELSHGDDQRIYSNKMGNTTTTTTTRVIPTTTTVEPMGTMGTGPMGNQGLATNV